MRLVLWNCAMGSERKLVALAALKPDIAVLSEIACPEKLRSKLPILSDLPLVWAGKNASKGLAVVSLTRSQPDLDPSYKSSHHFIPPLPPHLPNPFLFPPPSTHNHPPT